MPLLRVPANVLLQVVSVLAVFLIPVVWSQPLLAQKTDAAQPTLRKHPKLSTPLAALARSIPPVPRCVWNPGNCFLEFLKL